MPDYFEKLKSWYEEVVKTYGEYSEKAKSLFYVEEDKIKIPFLVVESLVSNYYGTKEFCDQLQDMLSESDDFIRLLRKENKELRGE